jgi:transporter family protein
MGWFLFALAASVFLTLASLAQKEATHHERAIQVGVASTILQATLALFLIPYLRFEFPLWIWPLLLVSGVTIAFGFYYFIKAFKVLDSSVVSPLFNLGTVAVVILSLIFLKETLTPIQTLGVLLLILGTYILELKKGHIFSPFVELYKSKKIHLILVSTLLYSLHAVLSKFLLFYIEPITYIFIEVVLMAVVLTLVAYIRHNGFKDIKRGFAVHRWMIVVIALFSLLAELATFFALNNGEASLVIPIVRTWTLFVVVLGGTFYKEGHLRNRIIATTIMLVGIFIIYL